MKITFIGTGYVGLVSGSCFSALGFDVTCVDKNKQKIDALKKGVLPIYEPGLDEIIEKQMQLDKLRFTTNIEDAVRQADVIFIAVGTPSRRGDGHADLTYVHQALREIANSIEGYKVIVIKSTVPIGTTKKAESDLRQEFPHLDIDMVSNPEFLREGSAIEDFFDPDRIIVGLASDKAKDIMQELYVPLTEKDIPILFTDRNTSETIKYASNAFLATKITFINEMADLCEDIQANIDDVAKGMGLDHRIGSNFLQTGPGYGGSCFPKDVRALIETGKDYDIDLKIITKVDQVNSKRKINMVEKIEKACGGSIKGKKLAILGLTFKANTDDMRESVSLTLIPELQKKGASCQVYDPQALHMVDQHFQDVIPCNNAVDCMDGADALVILTEWEEFKTLTPKQIASSLKQNIVIDLRNIFEPNQFEDGQFTYVSLGRPSIKPSNVVSLHKTKKSS